MLSVADQSPQKSIATISERKCRTSANLDRGNVGYTSTNIFTQPSNIFRQLPPRLRALRRPPPAVLGTLLGPRAEGERVLRRTKSLNYYDLRSGNTQHIEI